MTEVRANVTAPIVLFDLDGTVLTFDGTPPGPGRTALERAMKDLHGVERATDGVRVAGGTDRALARTMLRRAGLAETEAAIDRLLDEYVAQLEAVLRVRRYLPIGDVAGAVDALARRGAIVGLATGNMRRGAILKLSSAGLLASFDVVCGAYGCEAEPRADIVRLAAERCGWTARAGRPVVVVGDTEHDVAAARAMGARVVGVATDGDSRAELAAAAADAIVPTCGDALVEAVMAAA
jgi:phosphoglycolate phosphatase-like HAD superfamily hydrolase